MLPLQSSFRYKPNHITPSLNYQWLPFDLSMTVKLLNMALVYLSSAHLTLRFEFWSSHIECGFLDHLHQFFHPGFQYVLIPHPSPPSHQLLNLLFCLDNLTYFSDVSSHSLPQRRFPWFFSQYPIKYVSHVPYIFPFIIFIVLFCWDSFILLT